MRSPLTLLCLILVLAPASLRADELLPMDGDATPDARRAFVEGVEAVKKAQWSEALLAFERSSRLRPHATTTFSIGACERALGRSSRARATFRRAIEEGAARGNQLPASLVNDAQTFIAEIDRLQAHVQVQLNPPGTEISVDGRPLLEEPGGYPLPIMVAGMLPPGAATAPPAPAFEMIIEPGAHVIMLSRKGYKSVTVKRTFDAGTRSVLPLEVERLPAVLQVTSTPPGGIVAVEDIDVGPAPVQITRAPGSYRVVVRKAGLRTFQSQVTLQAGEEVDLQAPLPVEKRPIYKQWWFWTTGAVLIGGIIGLTYGLTRPPAPFDGGNTGWVAETH
jgi:hypothetical protein